MNLFNRGLLAVYVLVITVLLAVTAAILVGWWPEGTEIVNEIVNDPKQAQVLWTSFAVLVAVGLWLFYASTRRSKEQRAVVQEFTLGQLRITLPAIEELVKKEALKIDGVREVIPKIAPTSGGVSIEIKTTVAPDINIPEISQQMQRNVKEYILEVTGISVQNVKIMVERISINRSRVE
ncbi:MAG: alkaline shock response membrane anchor protein AmaP [Firmicutes bacterium]|nr:alkaline shock response membrane anchor protein AmaP [Bacillota bacterium]